MAHWTVYILQCSDQTLYTGITNDLPARIAAHKAGKGAKYTKGRAPFVLIHSEEFETRSDASKRESEIKKMPRNRKLDLAARHVRVGNSDRNL